MGPEAAACQDSMSSAASDATHAAGNGAAGNGAAAGGKRAAEDGGGEGGVAKAAKTAGNVPLQREASMGNGELIDGVAGAAGGGGGGFKLNLQ